MSLKKKDEDEKIPRAANSDERINSTIPTLRSIRITSKLILILFKEIRVSEYLELYSRDTALFATACSCKKYNRQLL